MKLFYPIYLIQLVLLLLSCAPENEISNVKQISEDQFNQLKEYCTPGSNPIDKLIIEQSISQIKDAIKTPKYYVSDNGGFAIYVLEYKSNLLPICISQTETSLNINIPNLNSGFSCLAFELVKRTKTASEGSVAGGNGCASGSLLMHFRIALAQAFGMSFADIEDASSVTCTSFPAAKYSLAQFKQFEKGETWYEGSFGFEPRDLSEEQKLKRKGQIDKFLATNFGDFIAKLIASVPPFISGSKLLPLRDHSFFKNFKTKEVESLFEIDFLFRKTIKEIRDPSARLREREHKTRSIKETNVINFITHVLHHFDHEAKRKTRTVKDMMIHLHQSDCSQYAILDYVFVSAEPETSA